MRSSSRLDNEMAGPRLSRFESNVRDWKSFNEGVMHLFDRVVSARKLVSCELFSNVAVV